MHSGHPSDASVKDEVLADGEKLSRDRQNTARIWIYVTTAFDVKRKATLGQPHDLRMVAVDSESAPSSEELANMDEHESEPPGKIDCKHAT